MKNNENNLFRKLGILCILLNVALLILFLYNSYVGGGANVMQVFFILLFMGFSFVFIGIGTSGISWLAHLYGIGYTIFSVFFIAHVVYLLAVYGELDEMPNEDAFLISFFTAFVCAIIGKAGIIVGNGLKIGFPDFIPYLYAIIGLVSAIALSFKYFTNSTSIEGINGLEVTVFIYLSIMFLITYFFRYTAQEAREKEKEELRAVLNATKER